jgi:hypothetical protein
MSNYSLSFGFKLTHDLDDRFNLTRKSVLSQRDVPGMTRGLIPILAANGIIGISEGSNSRVFPGQLPSKDTAPVFPSYLWSGEWGDVRLQALVSHPASLCLPLVNVPPAFLWRDPASGHEVIGLWHAYDYGQLPGAKVQWCQCARITTRG